MSRLRQTEQQKSGKQNTSKNQSGYFGAGGSKPKNSSGRKARKKGNPGAY